MGRIVFNTIIYSTCTCCPSITLSDMCSKINSLPMNIDHKVEISTHVHSILVYHRYPNLCTTLGVHSPCAEEASVPLHDQLGEQKRRSFPIPRCPCLRCSLGQAQKSSQHDIRQGCPGSSLLLQEGHSEPSWWKINISLQQEIKKTVHYRRLTSLESSLFISQFFSTIIMNLIELFHHMTYYDVIE